MSKPLWVCRCGVTKVWSVTSTILPMTTHHLCNYCGDAKDVEAGPLDDRHLRLVEADAQADTP